MNNIQKSFKTKSALRMANGGQVDTRDERLRQVDDMSRGANQQASTAATTSQTGVPMPQNPPKIPGPMDNLKDQVSKLRKAIGLKEGGPVRGPGGPTDDKVDAKLSDGEFVLPADTVQAVGAHNLEALRQATHTPVGGRTPQSKSRLRMANGGGVGFDETMDPILEMQKRARLVHAADAEFAAQPPRVPVQTNVAPNTGFGEVTPSPDELRLRNLSNAQRAGLPPYPQETVQASEIPRSEFDAARASRAGVTAAPEAATATATGAGETAAGVSRVGNAARSIPNALRAAPAAIGRGALGLAGSTLRNVVAPAIVGQAAYNTVANAGDSDYDARFGFQDGSALNNPITRALGVPESVRNSLSPAAGIRAAGIDPNGTTANLLTGASRLPIDALGAGSDFAINAAKAVRGMIPGLGSAQASSAPASGVRPSFIEPNSGQIPDSALRLSAAGAQRQRDNGGITAVQDRTGNPNDIIGTFQGRPITRGQSDVLSGGQSLGGTATQVSALRAPNLDAMGSGFNQVNSRAGDINKHFDDLSKQIQDLHGGATFHANGSLATKLLKVEEARADALGRDQSNLVGSQGNQVSDLGNKRSNAAGIYGTDVGADSALRRDQVTDQGNRLSAAASLYKAQQDDNKQNFEQTNTLLNQIFTSDKDGKANNKYGLTASEVQSQLARNPTIKIDGKDVNINDLPPSERVQAIMSAAGGATMKNNINASAGIFGDQDSNAQLGSVVIPDSNPLDIGTLLQHHVSLPSILRHGLNPTHVDDRISQVSNGDYRYTDDITGGDADLEEMAGNTRKKK